MSFKQSESGDGLGPCPRETDNTQASRIVVRFGVQQRLALLDFSVAISLGKVLAALAIFVIPLKELQDRPIDLVAFSLALAVAAGAFLLVWCGQSLYLLLKRRYRSAKGLPPGEDGLLPRLVTHPVWRDRLIAPLLLGALILNLGIFAYVSARYANLPPFLPLHYNASGDVDRLGTPLEVFMMPGIGLVVLTVDVLAAAGLYRRERLAGQILVGTATFVQALLLIATMNIVSTAWARG